MRPNTYTNEDVSEAEALGRQVKWEYSSHLTTPAASGHSPLSTLGTVHTARDTNTKYEIYKLSDISIPGCPGLRVASGCCWSLGEENNIDSIVSLPSAVRCPPGSSNCRDYECAGQETIGSLGAFDDDKRDHCALHQYSTHAAYLCHP